jgi:hypothetical protein
MEDEIILKGAVKSLDPQYLYFLDSEGNLRKKKKGGKRKKTKAKVDRVFTSLNLTVPKILLRGLISRREKKVIKYGSSGAMISMPKFMIGMKGKVIFIPSEAMADIEENVMNLM